MEAGDTLRKNILLHNFIQYFHSVVSTRSLNVN